MTHSLQIPFKHNKYLECTNTWSISSEILTKMLTWMLINSKCTVHELTLVRGRAVTVSVALFTLEDWQSKRSLAFHKMLYETIHTHVVHMYLTTCMHCIQICSCTVYITLIQYDKNVLVLHTCFTFWSWNFMIPRYLAVCTSPFFLFTKFSRIVWSKGTKLTVTTRAPRMNTSDSVYDERLVQCIYRSSNEAFCDKLITQKPHQKHAVLTQHIT